MTAAKAKSAAAKRTAAQAAPFQLGTRTAEAEREREPLFSIDDQVYTMPVAVPAGDAISLATLLRVQPDEDAKGCTLVRHLCGQDALRALLGDSTMSRNEWKAIVRVLTERAFGPPEEEDEAEGN